jgi:Peptidase M50B-like
MNDATSRKLKFLAGFALYFGALWLLWDTPVVYPLKIFVVLLHEASHAIVALATGGSVHSIVLDPREGGATLTYGGNAFLTLSAGYLGSLAWGALMVEASRARRIPPKLVNALIGGLVIALTALYVRSLFGVIFGVAFGGAMIAFSRQMSIALNKGLLLTLGMTSALYAILDIKSDILDRPHAMSDAAMLSKITGVPTMAWGVVWIAIALGVTALLFRRAYRKA